MLVLPSENRDIPNIYMTMTFLAVRSDKAKPIELLTTLTETTYPGAHTTAKNVQFELDTNTPKIRR